METPEVQRMISEIESFLRAPEPDEPGYPPHMPRKGPRPTLPAWRRPLFAILVAIALIVGFTEFFQAPPQPLSGRDLASNAPAGPGYKFLATNRSGTPVRWNPCEAIRYTTDFSGAPAYAGTDLAQAIKTISQVSGLRFVQVPPAATQGQGGPKGSAASSPVEAGAPVLISWGVPGSGLARAVPVAAVDQMAGHAVYVSGTVSFYTPAARLAPGFGPGGLGVLMLRELAQLVGLAPVASPGELMDPSQLPRLSGFGPGDLIGLRRLGSASGCISAAKGSVLEPVL